MIHIPLIFLFFFFNDTATTEIYTLSLHDALPIYEAGASESTAKADCVVGGPRDLAASRIFASGLRGADLPHQYRTLQPTHSALDLLWTVRGCRAQRFARGRDPNRARPPPLRRPPYKADEGFEA